jgi:hypothetical protein
MARVLQGARGVWAYGRQGTAVIPASVHHRETRVMKIPSSGCEEHALPSQSATDVNIFRISP